MENVWTFDPVAISLVVVALAFYRQGYLRLRARSGATHADASRALLFAAGLAVCLLAIVSPVHAVGEDQLLSAHMLQHLMLGDLGPLLLVLGVRGPLSVFLLPPALLTVVARSKLRRLVSWLLRPSVSLGFWLLTLGAWHVPAAYDAAIAHPLLHSVEHACFFLAGLLAWTQIVDPARRRRLSVGQRAMFAFVMLLASSVLAEVLVAMHPLYPHYVDVVHRPFGWSAWQDQSRAAALMMSEQMATLGIAILFLVRAHVERVSVEVPGFAEHGQS